MSDVVSYKCPNCSAGLSFDIDTQHWDCKFCGGSFELGQLEGQDPEASSKPESAEQEVVLESPHDQYGEEAVAFSCPSCGGHIVTDKNTAATFCVYCHNPTVLAARLDGEYRPAQLIPFQVKKEEMLGRLKAFCKKRPFLPKDFRQYIEKGEVAGLYVPFWLFDSDISASLDGLGYRITSWSDSRYRYTKTDTYKVERRGKFSFRGVPADGSQRMDDRLMEALEPFDYSGMVDFSMGYLSGHFAESYDVDATEGGKRALPRMRGSVEKMLQSEVKLYTRFQTTAMNSTPSNTKSRYVMLPVWTLSADYKGKRYTYAMNGQTGKVAGSLPVSWQRFFAYFGAIWAVLAVLFLGGVSL